MSATYLIRREPLALDCLGLALHCRLPDDCELGLKGAGDTYGGYCEDQRQRQAGDGRAMSFFPLADPRRLPRRPRPTRLAGGGGVEVRGHSLGTWTVARPSSLPASVIAIGPNRILIGIIGEECHEI